MQKMLDANALINMQRLDLYKQCYHWDKCKYKNEWTLHVVHTIAFLNSVKPFLVIGVMDPTAVLLSCSVIFLSKILLSGWKYIILNQELISA